MRGNHLAATITGLHEGSVKTKCCDSLFSQMGEKNKTGWYVF